MTDLIIDNEFKNLIPLLDEKERGHQRKRSQTKKSSSGTLPNTVVYVFDIGNNICKIGISKRVAERAKEISNQSGRKVLRYRHTKKQTTNVTARAIEQACHKYFNSHRMQGEFFNAGFEDICNFLESYLPLTEELFI